MKAIPLFIYANHKSLSTFSHDQAGIRTQAVVRDSVQSVAAPQTIRPSEQTPVIHAIPLFVNVNLLQTITTNTYTYNAIQIVIFIHLTPSLAD